MQNGIYSVSEVTTRLKHVLETSFFMVWIKGEVSGVRSTSAGHTYFTLKDANAQIACVWFAGKRLLSESRRIDPLTGEVFAAGSGVTLASLERGGEFLCSGKISYYAKSGACQLVVEHIITQGEGLLAQAFEARKQDLAQKGYFSSDRKRPIPKNPSRVALITSEQGAAIHDFLTIASQRGLSSHIRLFPSLVQGDGAAMAIADAIHTVNEQGWAEVIVLIRGGGSLEDLWCFNEESVATAIFQSAIPVLAGIGHEIDTTLADMTADVRAATPTHAAELLWETRETLRKHLTTVTDRLTRALQERLSILAQRLAHEERALSLSSPKNRLRLFEDRLLHTEKAMHLAVLSFFEQKKQRYERLDERFRQSLLPASFDRRVLLLKSLESRLGYHLERMTHAWERTLFVREEKLTSLAEAWLGKLSHELATMDRVLATQNPGVLLARGYALVENEKGELVTSTAHIETGQHVTLRLSDGRLLVEVLEKQNASLEP